MPTRYGIVHQQDVAAENNPFTLIYSRSEIRIHLYDMIIGSESTPSNDTTEFMLNLSTSSGTTASSTLVCHPLDPLSAASDMYGFGGPWGGNPSETANSGRLMIALHQQSVVRWTANPGHEIVSVAAEQNGLQTKFMTSTGTPRHNITQHWWE